MPRLIQLRASSSANCRHWVMSGVVGAEPPCSAAPTAPGRQAAMSTTDGVVVITPARLEGIDWRHPQHTWRPDAAG